MNTFAMANFIGSFISLKDMPTDKPHVCFLGRSNSGKSSLLSSLIQNKKIVKVSSKPGSTITLNVFELKSVYLVDLPGYGYAKRSYAQRDSLSRMISNYINNNDILLAGFLTADCRRTLKEEELTLANYFRELRKPLILALTKVDKLNAKEKSKVTKEMKTYEEKYHSVMLVSSTKKVGQDQIIRFISSLTGNSK